MKLIKKKINCFKVLDKRIKIKMKMRNAFFIHPFFPKRNSIANFIERIFFNKIHIILQFPTKHMIIPKI